MNASNVWVLAILIVAFLFLAYFIGRRSGEKGEREYYQILRRGTSGREYIPKDIGTEKERDE